MEPLVAFRDVHFRYENTEVLRGLSMHVEPGDFLALVGPNGSGKSTVVKLILGLLKPTDGEIVRRANVALGYVPQLGAERSYGFPITPYELVGLNLDPQKPGGFWHRKDEEERIRQALIKVDMWDRRKDLFSTLSGGMRQRVLIAKALVHEPSFLLLDEPTVGLDEKSRLGLMKLLAHFNEHHGLTLLMVTHERDGLEALASRIVRLSDGKAVEEERV